MNFCIAVYLTLEYRISYARRNFFCVFNYFFRMLICLIGPVNIFLLLS